MLPLIPFALGIVLATLAGALGRRVAGGLLSYWLRIDVGTQSQRLLWAATAGGTAWAAGGAWWLALAVGAGIWAGSCVFGFGLPGHPSTGMLMGRRPGSRPPQPSGHWWRDAGGSLWHGLGGVPLPVLALAWGGAAWWWVLAAGALCPACYEVAWRWPLHCPALGCFNDPRPGMVPDPPPTAELLWGAVVGAAVFLAVWLS